MNDRVIIDTGPLVSVLVERDAHHAWSASQLRNIQKPLLTCEAVLTETFHLMRRNSRGRDALCSWLANEVIRISFQVTGEEEALSRLMKRYANVPMSLADACLVRMSELHSDCRVFTLDSDFRVYRRDRRRVIPLLIPPGR